MKLLHLEAGEVPMVWRAALVAFAIAFGQIAGEASYPSLFSIRYGVEYLPVMYMIEVAIIPLEIWLFVKLARHYGKAVFFKLVFGCLTAAIALTGFVLIAGYGGGWQLPWFYPVLYLVSNIADRGFVTTMWMLAEELCTTRQAKRIFPLLIGSYTLGSIMAGLVIHHLASSDTVSTEQIYLLWPLMMAIAGYFWRQLISRYLTPVSDLTESSESADLPASIKVIACSPFLRVALVVMMIIYGLAFVMEYELNAVSKAVYTNEEDVTAFWGLFLAAFYLAALVVGGVALGPMLEKLGIGNVVIMIGACAALAFGELTLFVEGSMPIASVFAGGLLMYIAMYTIADPVYQLFFKTLPDGQRTGARLVFGGALFAGGKLLCSALSVLHSASYVSLTGLSLIGLCLAAILIMLALRQKGLYFTELLNNAAACYIPLPPEPRQWSGETLSREETATIASLLQPHAKTHQLGLELCRFLKNPALWPHIQPFLTSSSVGLRLLALEAAAHTSPDALPLIRQALGDRDPQIAALAAGLLETVNDPVTTLSRATIICQLIDRGNDSACFACEAIGSSNWQQFAPELTRLLTSSHLPLACTAVTALGQLDQASAIPAMLAKLPQAGRAYARTANQALLAMGPSARPYLLAALDEGNPLIWQTAVTALAGLNPDQPTLTLLTRLCQEKLDSVRGDSNLPWALHEVRQPHLAALAKGRLMELQQPYCEAAWAVLGATGGERIAKTLQWACSQSDQTKREAALDVLGEGFGNRLLSQALLRVLEEQYREPAPPNTSPVVILQNQSSGEYWLNQIAATALQWEQGANMNNQPVLTELAKMVLLRQAAPFEGLSLEELSRIAAIAAEHRHPDQTILVQAGTVSSCLHIIAVGHVELIGTASRGGEGTIGVLGSGQCCGDDSILSNQPSALTAQCILGEVTTLAIDGSQLRHLLQLYPDMALGMLAATASRLQLLHKQLLEQG